MALQELHDIRRAVVRGDVKRVVAALALAVQACACTNQQLGRVHGVGPGRAMKWCVVFCIFLVVDLDAGQGEEQSQDIGVAFCGSDVRQVLHSTHLGHVGHVNASS